MPLKVLIADDEIHICQLVQHLVDWEALDLKIVATVHNGVAALEHIIREAPDIIISDIRMPGFSGIELMKKTRAQGMRSRFILISGYQEFELAKSAIAYGVTDYLVKPIKKDELLNALIKARVELGESELRYESSKKESDEGERKQQFLNAIASGKRKLEQIDKDALFRACGLDMHGECMVYAWQFICASDYAHETFHLIADKAVAYLQEHAASLFPKFMAYEYADRVCLIGAMDDGYNHPSTMRVYEHFSPRFALLEGWTCVLGTSSWQDAVSLASASQDAVQAASSCIFYPDLKVFSAEETAHRTITDFHAVINYEHRDELLACVQLLDAPKFTVRLRHVFELFAQTHALSAIAVSRFAIWVCTASNHTLLAFGVETEKSTIKYWNRTALEQELQHAASLADMEARILFLICDAIEEVHLAVEAAENRPIRVVKEAVAARYMENLNLNSLAEEVQLNPVYLSSLFKKETGINFKEYLTRVRIDMAKKMLRGGENMVYVAEKVGYHDAKYFSKTFTKLVGVTPSQYKKLYR